MSYLNKEDQAASAKRHYEKNKAAIKKRSIAFSHKFRKQLKEWVRNYLSTHPCVDCGFSDIRALDFDHVRGNKNHNISNMVRSGYSMKKILEEIAKCEIRCSNCHRIQTCIRRSKKLGGAVESNRDRPRI